MTIILIVAYVLTLTIGFFSRNWLSGISSFWLYSVPVFAAFLGLLILRRCKYNWKFTIPMLGGYIFFNWRLFELLLVVLIFRFGHFAP